jgi:DNA invertase Pin-like site-specific DNA recombinase
MQSGRDLGVEHQVLAYRKIAAERDWAVSEECVDNDIAVHAGKRRPACERMLEGVAIGQRDSVIVYNSDPLTRRTIELEPFTAVCEGVGVRQLVALACDVDNDDGMFVARVLGVVAAKESGGKEVGLQVREASAQSTEDLRGVPALRRGAPVWLHKSQLVAVESEAAVLRKLTERFLAGEATVSLNQVAD